LALGLGVTVIDRDPPLRRLLGPWLSEHVVRTAERSGLRVVVAEAGVVLEGNPIASVAYGHGQRLEADLVITAAGDQPTVGWLESSGLRIESGLVIDRCCRVAPGIVAAGDVTAVEDPAGTFRRTPHWTSAVEQARTAARCLPDP